MGKAMTRQMTVAMTACTMPRANTVVYAPRPMMFSSVKLPALSVNAKYTTMASGTATNTTIHTM